MCSAAIALTEKGCHFDRINIELSQKPDWFRAISPMGKVPLLTVGDAIIFESIAILEYLEDTLEPKLHPASALQKADHRGWIEFGSTILNDLGGFYASPDKVTFEGKRRTLSERFTRLEERILAKPWFDGDTFSLVDAVFGPIFRYFDTFDEIADFGILRDKPKLTRWRFALGSRPSIQNAVAPDYSERLRQFIGDRNSHLSKLQSAKSSLTA